MRPRFNWKHGCGETKILLEPSNVWWVVLDASNTVWRIHSLNTKGPLPSALVLYLYSSICRTLLYIAFIGVARGDAIENDQISDRGKYLKRTHLRNYGSRYTDGGCKMLQRRGQPFRNAVVDKILELRMIYDVRPGKPS